MEDSLPFGRRSGTIRAIKTRVGSTDKRHAEGVEEEREVPRREHPGSDHITISRRAPRLAILAHSPFLFLFWILCWGRARKARASQTRREIASSHKPLSAPHVLFYWPHALTKRGRGFGQCGASWASTTIPAPWSPLPLLQRRQLAQGAVDVDEEWVMRAQMVGQRL